MPIYPRGTAASQDLDDLLGALRVGSDQDELAFVIERRGVAIDYVLRQVIIGKMGLKGPDNGVPVRLGWQLRLPIMPGVELPGPD
jgi:hypothetical protein